MGNNTAYNHYKALLSSVKDTFSACRIYHSTHEQLLDRLNRYVYDTDHWKRIPQYYQMKLSGYIESCHDHLQHEMIYQYNWRGIWYSWDSLMSLPEWVDKDSPERMDLWKELSHQSIGGFFWKDKPDKPFYISDNQNEE